MRVQPLSLQVLNWSKRNASKLSFEDRVPKRELGNESKREQHARNELNSVDCREAVAQYT
jgi:hypothetical protein